MPSRMSTIQFLYKLKHLFDKTWVEVTKLMCHIISCHLSLNMWTYQEPWVSLMSCQDIKQKVNLSFFGLYQKHRWKIIRKSLAVDQPIHRQYDKALQTLQSWVQKTILVPTQLGWLRYSGSPVSSETIVWVTQLCFSFTGLWWLHAFKYSPWSGINYATFLLFSFTVQ